MTKISIVDLNKSFNTKKNKNTPNFVLKNINLTAEPGEFLVLVGPSGCGKSTLLKIIAGLENSTTGKIFFNDELINDKLPKDRDIGLVFQNYALYPHLTVFENLAFPLKIKKIKSDEIKRIVQNTAELLNLKEFLNRKPKTLSGGQRQRVALGRVIVREPKVFLFDEPLSNLDAKLRTKMRTEITAIQKKFAVTSIYVTHDQTEAMTMGDRIVVMKDGEIMQQGTPDEVYNEPANIFVATFIGSPSINLFNATIDSDNVISLDHNKYKIQFKGKNFQNSKEQMVIVGLRPENIFLDDESDFKYQIRAIEKLGHESLIYFDFNGDNKVIRTSKPISMESGNLCGLNFNFDKSVIFTPVGKRVY